MQDQVPYHVLVVDDEEAFRSLIQQSLTRLGYTSSASANAREALSALATEHYDLVLSDIRMGGMDGLQLMKEALERHPHLGFIMMTGHAGDYTYSDIIEAGAADFISKPFSLGELKAKLERIERERSTLRELQEKNEALALEAEINTTFAELSKALLSPLSFESISDMVLDCARRLTHSNIGFVGYIDPQSGHFVCPTMSREVWENCHVDGKDVIFKKFTGLWGWVLENRMPILSNAPREDARSSGVPSGHVPIQRFLAAPAMAEARLMGLVGLANSPQSYTERDALLVRRLANIFALVIDRKWADENLKRTEEDLRRAKVELQQLVEERTAKLSRAGEAMMRSIHRFREITDESGSLPDRVDPSDERE